MKKLFLMLGCLFFLHCYCNVQYSMAQQNSAPPLLIPQNQVYAGQQTMKAPLPPQTPQSVAAPLVNGIQPPPPPPANVIPALPITRTVTTKRLLMQLEKAVSTAQKISHLLSLGKIWIMRGPEGEIEIKAGLIYQGVVVAVLHLDPLNGAILPEGLKPYSYRTGIGLDIIKQHLSPIIPQLKIILAARFVEPEACWVFPMTFGNSVVSHIKIYYDGFHVVQDYPANQEMIFYGQ